METAYLLDYTELSHYAATLTLKEEAKNNRLETFASFSPNDDLDVNLKFKLGSKITPLQKAFFEKYGFIHFKNVFSKETTGDIKEELKKAANTLVDQQKLKINGVPVKFGYDLEGKLIVQRLPFSSTFSSTLHNQVNRKEIQSLLELVPGGRIGETEKDGVVANHYVNGEGSTFKRMGWHTDALRDIFYLQKVMPMLNVGIHLDSSPAIAGGLRIVPGTHNQGLLSMIFGKPYFISHKPDPKEIAVETEEGDLTIHDGRLWHRAEAPSVSAGKGQRRVIYFPIVSGVFKPKSEDSPTPLYLRLMKNIRPFGKK